MLPAVQKRVLYRSIVPMRRRLILALSLIFVIGAGSIAAHFFRFGYGQCHPRRTLVSAAERARAQRSLPNLAEVSFDGPDGVTLRGWFAPPRNGTVVILVHGLFSNRAGLLPEAEVFARHGYGVLLFDSRAHGESDGTVATWGSREAFDIASAIRFVKAQPQVARVALLGFSVGASAVARAAANDQTVAAVILYATWPSLREEISYKEPHGRVATALALLGFRAAGVEIDEIKPEADLARISPRPLLFVAGGRDTDTPRPIMARMYASASGDKEWWLVPEAEHGGCFAAEPAEYERRVVGFLDRALAAAR